MGSFVSHSDMQSGSPGFGGPESAIGLLASGQIARRYGLLWRAGGGGLTSSQRADAQAACGVAEHPAPAFLAGANLVLHAAGWLESGLVASYEKYILDIELLRILPRAAHAARSSTTPAWPFDAHAEVGHGGHFFGAQHTLERFRDCFYRPLVFSTENLDRWLRNGSLDAATARQPARGASCWRPGAPAARRRRGGRAGGVRGPAQAGDRGGALRLASRWRRS